MARRKKNSPRSFGSYLLGIAALGVVCLAIWVIYLDHVVTTQFEGRRWTLPAQVYAQPRDLYAGLAMTAGELEQELRRLGYQAVDSPQRPGTYRRSGIRIDLAARRAQFADEVREPMAISFVAGGNGIERIFDSRGNDIPVFRLDPLLIGSIFPIHGEDRIVLTPEQVPELLPAALKVVEDRKFDRHIGVDPLGIARAALVNIRAGSLQQGASTLTQQLVRSYFLTNKRTWSRKIEEALMAIIIEVRFDKQDIMNAYINEIFLGQDGERAVHGFGLASEYYFGKPLTELELHEIAALVAVVRGPSFYDARRRPDRVQARRDLVLDLMTEFGIVTEQQASNAKSRPLGISSQVARASGYHPAFLDMVRRSLRRDYREEDLTEAGLKVFTTLDPFAQASAEKALVSELEQLDRERRASDSNIPPLEGAIVVTSPLNGDVLAVVGGRRVGFSGFNRALDARRPLGSLVKPVVFLSALETGRYHAASMVQDAPVEIPLPNGDIWKPRNFNEDFNGPVSLTRAMSQSLNLATVNLGMDVGLAAISRQFVRLGLEREPLQVPAMLLGSVEASPLDVAQVYNTLANGGFRTPLRAVHAVLDAEGKPLRAFPLEVSRASDPAAVYQVNQMMVQVMEQGTGRTWRSRLPRNLTVAGKTGTTSDNRDSWFAGFSGSHLAVVWVGYDDNRPTGFTGSTGALPIWVKLMDEIKPDPWFTPMPAGLEETWVDPATGLAAGPGCTVEAVMMALPVDADLRSHPSCSRVRGMGERARDWFRGILP
jgi:penicillin-binding protein 1B